MSENVFLALGFGIVWIVLAFYLLTLARRQVQLRHEVERLERDLRTEERGQ